MNSHARRKNKKSPSSHFMEWEDRIAKWERITIRVAGYIAVSIILLVALVYSVIEGAKFLIDRFTH